MAGRSSTWSGRPRRARGAAGPPPRPRHRRARPARARRPARPRAAAAGGDAAGAAAAAGLARLPLVPGAAGRLSRPRDLPRGPRGAGRAARRALGGDRGGAGADRARRLLDGRGDELRDGAQRRAPAVAGILAFSGFVPTVEGWEPALRRSTGTRAFIAHGRRDPVIGVEFAERARQLLEAGGLTVTYRESELGHQIEPAHLSDGAELARRRRLPRGASGPRPR